MKAVIVREHGGPEVLKIEEIPIPEPRDDQVRIKIEAASVNFADTALRRGDRPTQLPTTPGVDGAGIVDALGAKVADLQIGERVAYCLGPKSYSEYVVIPAFKAMPIPEGINSSTAAGAMTTGLTAHYLTYTTHPIQEGETALVHAAASGTGLMIVQCAKRLGATVIGTTSSQDKADAALKAGADHVILYTQTDFEEEVRRLTKDQGVHVVYDPVGKATFEKSLKILRQRGDMVLFGHASGQITSFEPHMLNRCGSLKLTYPSLWHHAGTPEDYKTRARDVLNWVKSGEITVLIDQIFPLSEVQKAHQRVADRQVIGKLILKPKH